MSGRQLMAWLMTVLVVSACVADSEATQSAESQLESIVADTTLPAAILGEGGPVVRAHRGCGPGGGDGA